MPAGHCATRPEEGTELLDIVYVLGSIAVFVLVGLAAKGVEKL